MKAASFDRYGGSETMEFGDVADAAPGDGEIAVEIHAASVNPIDWKVREGYLQGTLDPPMPHVMGRDFSGVVTALGPGALGFAVGDEVFGVGTPGRHGSHAEAIAVDPATCARKPAGLSHLEAAALAISGLSAYAGLVTHGQLQAGEKVLIHAGAGGVGGLAVRLAKHLGAAVAATASAANADYVRALGADLAIDYRTQDFAAELSDYDLVFDLMGGEVHRRSYAVLRPGGRIAYLAAAAIEGEAPRDDVTAIPATVSYTTDLLTRVGELAVSGAVPPQVETVLPLAAAAAAYDLSQGGHLRGKIVLRVRG